jgi:DNA-binding beta-propeller fold protein YncE
MMSDRDIATAAVMSDCNGVAVSRDGATLLVSDCDGGSHAIHEFRVADGSRLRVIGGAGAGPLQFKNPQQLWVASDDHVFIADWGNDRVQVLTPARLDFHSFVGVGQLSGPAGVCANGAVVVVSESYVHRISVFNRGDGALLRRFGSEGIHDGQLTCPLGLCFMSDDRHVAVVDSVNCRVSAFSLEGKFNRHVGVGELKSPRGVACSPFDDSVLIVADGGRVVVLGTSCLCDSKLLTDFKQRTTERGDFTGIAMHGGTVVAQDRTNEKCVLFSPRIFRGEDSENRTIATRGVQSSAGGVAVRRDGSTLLVTDHIGGSHAIHEFRIADGSRLRVIGGAGDGPLQFKNPCQVWVAPDDSVFVADSNNNRVQLLTPSLDFHAFVGVGQLRGPVGVCADDDVIVVSEYAVDRVSVFQRGDGALLRRFGSTGSGDGQLENPLGLCFMSGHRHRHIAVADSSNNR